MTEKEIPAELRQALDQAAESMEPVVRPIKVSVRFPDEVEAIVEEIFDVVRTASTALAGGRSMLAVTMPTLLEDVDQLRSAVEKAIAGASGS
jgi:hypothetical protein